MSTDETGKKDNNRKKPAAARGRKTAESSGSASGKKRTAAKDAPAAKTKAPAAKKPARKTAKSSGRAAKAPARKLPDNVVQFPGVAGASGSKAKPSSGRQSTRRNDSASYYASSDYAISEVLEFASVTALETADLLGDIVDSAITHRIRETMHPLADPDSPMDTLLQLLNLVLVKLRGVSMLVPPGRVLKETIPNVETISGYEGLRRTSRRAAEKTQALLYQLFDRIYDSDVDASEYDVFSSDEVIDELDEVCDAAQEVAETLSDMISLWYDEFEDL